MVATREFQFKVDTEKLSKKEQIVVIRDAISFVYGTAPDPYKAQKLATRLQSVIDTMEGKFD